MSNSDSPDNFAKLSSGTLGSLLSINLPSSSHLRPFLWPMFLSLSLQASLGSFFYFVQFSSVTQSCPTLCDPMNRSTPGLPVHHKLPEFAQTHIHRVSEPSSHLILYRPLLLLPPIPPSIRVFSTESTLRIRWPKYWSFSFSNQSFQ